MTFRMAALSFLALSSAAYAEDPRVPPGKDPGGTAVALFTRGLDYTRPEIARLLARDGEGEVIGWDVVENDHRPFAASGAAQAAPLVEALGRHGGVRVVPVRVDPENSVSMARALVFAGRTPARVVVVPFASANQGDWETFAIALRTLPDLLVVVPAWDGKKEAVYPAQLKLDNVIAVANTSASGETSDVVIERETPEEAVAALASLYFGCLKLRLSAKGGSAMKAELLERLKGAGGVAAEPVCPAAGTGKTR